jgi:hypothetical protein
METELQKINQKLDLLLNEVRKMQGLKATAAEGSRFTIVQAAQKLNLSTSRVYALIYEGKLKPLQREKYSRIQFNQEILNQYLYGNKQ